MRSNIKGGSKAYDLVMSTNPVLCGDESPVITGKQIDIDPKQLTLYNTTGGSRKSYRKKRNSNKQKGGDSCNKKYGAHENHQHGGDSCNKKYGEYGNHQHGGDSCNKKYGAHENHQQGGKKKSRKKNKKSKSSRRKNIRKSNKLSKRKNIRRNKRGGSKASSAVLKGYPCNATNLVGGGTNNAFIANNCRGKSQSGGSDWRSTVYSRGSSSAPNMPLDQFRAFTQTGDYMANESMNSRSFMK
jgi:hypothetical protein